MKYLSFVVVLATILFAKSALAECHEVGIGIPVTYNETVCSTDNVVEGVGQPNMVYQTCHSHPVTEYPDFEVWCDGKKMKQTYFLDQLHEQVQLLQWRQVLERPQATPETRQTLLESLSKEQQIVLQKFYQRMCVLEATPHTGTVKEALLRSSLPTTPQLSCQIAEQTKALLVSDKKTVFVPEEGSQVHCSKTTCMACKNGSCKQYPNPNK